MPQGPRRPGAGGSPQGSFAGRTLEDMRRLWKTCGRIMPHDLRTRHLVAGFGGEPANPGSERPLVASLLLYVVRPGAPLVTLVASLLLVARPFVPSSGLLLRSHGVRRWAHSFDVGPVFLFTFA